MTWLWGWAVSEDVLGTGGYSTPLATPTGTRVIMTSAVGSNDSRRTRTFAHVTAALEARPTPMGFAPSINWIYVVEQVT